MTPLAQTMTDLAVIYVSNGQSLRSILDEVDAEVMGIAPGSGSALLGTGSDVPVSPTAQQAAADGTATAGMSTDQVLADPGGGSPAGADPGSPTGSSGASPAGSGAATAAGPLAGATAAMASRGTASPASVSGSGSGTSGSGSLSADPYAGSTPETLDWSSGAATPASYSSGAATPSYPSGGTPGSYSPAPTATPYGGLLGDAYSSGAGTLGSPAAASPYLPAGVEFGSDGQPYRTSPLPDYEGVALSPSDPSLGLPDGPATSGLPEFDELGLGAGGSGALDASPALADGLPGGGAVGTGGLGGGGFAGSPAALGAGAAAVPTAAMLTAPAGSVAPAAAVGGAATGAGGLGGRMMPMMPMGMMGGGGGQDGGDNDQRLPSWLVEYDDVWGEEAIVTAPVVGEAPAVPAPPTAGRARLVTD